MTVRLALTPGEPAGIGPDLVLSIIQQPLDAHIVVFADPDMLQQRAQLLSLPLTLNPFRDENNYTHRPGELTIVPVNAPCPVKAGLGNPDNAAYVIETLKQAVDFCQRDICHGLVTGPVNKGLINQSGIPFTGHTELLTELTNSDRTVMMLANRQFRVALATTHLPLSRVADAIKQKDLEAALETLHNGLLTYFTQGNPVIYVAGLNPHAGDNGALGEEEIDIIIPAIKNCQEKGINVCGPYSADTLFSSENISKADVFMTMFHDQGLPVLKFSGFGESVNITVGLNIIRTSVDHGTAMELAGSGKANNSSLLAAISTAVSMYRSSITHE